MRAAMVAPVHLTLDTLLDGLAARLAAPPSFHGCGPETTITDLVVDSREVVPGCAFLALRGETHDAHRFVPEVLAKGAAVALIAADAPTPEGPHVRLSDTGVAYPFIAANRHGWPAERLTLAGVTGTNGKTTTAHLVASMLAEAEHPHARLGTTGNVLAGHQVPSTFTTPFPHTLQALLAEGIERGATHGVMEVSSHALAQGRVRPIRFQAVGLTSFSQDHLDFHPDMDRYLEAKCRLAAEHLRPDGLAVAAVDEVPGAPKFLAAAKQSGATTWRASIGGEPTAEVVASKVQLNNDGMRAHVETPAGTLELRSPLLGAYNLGNVLVAIGLGIGLGLSLPVMQRALTTATGAPGRMQRVRVTGVSGPEVLVDYAHTPEAVQRVLQTLRPLCQGQLVVVLGCGGDRDPTKRPQMGQVAAHFADRFFATSDNPRTEDPEQIVDQMLAGAEHPEATVIREVDRARAIRRAITGAAPGDIVLLAGKGHEDYQVLGTERIHFDDRKHATQALRQRLSSP